MLKRSSIKYAVLLVLGAMLSVFTMVFAAVPMRIVRKSYGRGLYWVGHLAVGAALAVFGMPMFGLAYLAMTLMIGAHAELEDYGSSTFSTGFMALAITAGVGALATAAWMYQTKTDLIGVVHAQVSEFATQMAAMNAGTQMNVDLLVKQVPSALAILLVLALAAGLIWERRAQKWFGLPRAERGAQDLTEYRVPDVGVWITMLSVLGAFLQHGQPWLEALALNVLNLLVVAYFFQGLAVVARFFRTFKVNEFWQGFWYILIVIQLFLLVALLGFADFWLDFRQRFGKKTPEINKSF